MVGALEIKTVIPSRVVLINPLDISVCTSISLPGRPSSRHVRDVGVSGGAVRQVWSTTIQGSVQL